MNPVFNGRNHIHMRLVLLILFWQIENSLFRCCILSLGRSHIFRIWPSAAQTIRSSRGWFTGPIAIASATLASEGVCNCETKILVFTSTSDRITIARTNQIGRWKKWGRLKSGGSDERNPRSNNGITLILLLFQVNELIVRHLFLFFFSFLRNRNLSYIHCTASEQLFEQ